jgi:hypothetical protein
MVLAMVGQDNPELQQQMEASVAAALRKKGTTATSFFAAYGPKALYGIDEQTAIAKLKKSGADAVLTIVLLDTANQLQYVPGTVTYYPVDYYYRFWGYYGTVYDRVYTPGYYTTETNYYWESNLYMTNNEELLYSVRTESFEPSSTLKLADQYGRTIVHNMIQNGIITK